jgi:glutaconate CoA-transferase subunit A
MTWGENDRMDGINSKKTKLTIMAEAIAEFVHDGDIVMIEGFTHLICFAAGHEIIRQKKRDLTLCRLTPDLIYDQMIGAGCVRKVIFGWAGNPGVGPLYAFRRAVEENIPQPLEVEEYSHAGMTARIMAGAAGLPFFPLNNYGGSDLPDVNASIQTVTCPYTGVRLATVPALKPDVAIIHAQRVDEKGNTQVWGLLGVQKETAFAARHVIVVAEELVDDAVIRSDPNRTLIPGIIVDAVVIEPFGCHPSYVQGFYDRDNPFYIEWAEISKDRTRFEAYLEEWIYGVKDRNGYLVKLGEKKMNALKAKIAMSEPVNYGF